MAFQHEGMDGFCTVLNLSKNIIQNLWLPGGIFAAVCMATIDHQGTGSIDIAKECFCLFDKISGKIRSCRHPAKSTGNLDSPSGNRRGTSVLGDSKKGLALSGGNDAVYRCLKIATGGIFKSTGMDNPDAI